MKPILLICIVLLSSVNLAATDVSGNQFGNWTPVNSPYNVIGNVTVPSGNNLTILPGVIVNVMGNYTITAQGTLYATGTEGDSVRFVSGQADPNALWGGIRLESPSQGNLIQRCYIEKAEYGINSINSPGNINNNRFYKNKKGMQLYAIGAAEPALVMVTENVIEWSIENGILVTQNTNVQIQDNELRYNGTSAAYRGAIQLANQSAGGSCSPLISGNYIHHNFKQGITAWDIVGANAIEPQILNNTIEYNLTGIYLLNASGYVGQNIIRYNFITGDTNSGAGVMVAGATSHPFFEENEIYGNYTGFYFGNNAQPCLGDLSIDHVWAQGENQIHDNIDGSNVLHSVYTYSYTNPSIIIYAENNYWGTNEAAEIPLGINDHFDDAALPTVDFDPFITEQTVTTVLGTVSYGGSQNLSNPRIQLVSATSGEILEEYPIVIGVAFSLEISFLENFHAVVLADVNGSDTVLYGCAGGFTEPGVFSPGDLVAVEVGNIVIQDLQAPRYQVIGAPEVEGAHTLYPVYNNLLVYHWEYINWLYQQDDYLYIKRYTRYNDAENITFNFPDGTVWDKIVNITANDTWTRTEILDDSGTQRLSNFIVKTVTDAMVTANKNAAKEFQTLFIQRDAASDSLICIRMIGMQYRRLYHYADNYVYRCEDIIPNIGEEYLLEGNYWSFIPVEPLYSPFFLSFDYLEHYDTDINLLTLYWQAPAADDVHMWTHYRLYNYDQIYETVPFSQNYWHTDYLPNQDYLFTVCATDGTEETALTNNVWVLSVAADDPVAIPPVLSVQPNPATPGYAGGVSILINSGKALSGKIGIYNLRGQLVKCLTVESEAGFSCRWDLKDDSGKLCASGVYFLKADLKGENSLIRRMALIK